GEDYVRSVNTEGDGAEALRRYLADGGTLLLLGRGPYPMYYPMARGKADTTSREHLLPALGLPLRVTFESPPEGVTLTVRRNPDVAWLADLPEESPFPGKGDVRLRSLMPDDVPDGVQATPLLTIVGDDGADYGMAAVLIEHTAGDLQGGRILYVWGPLLNHEAMPGLLPAILAWLADEVGAGG
ncbi:MAG: hypothetical protein ACE5O2_09415, partial [Armatimonadota bacterium]